MKNYYKIQKIKFRRQVCIGNVHEVVIEEQVQQYFESYAGSGKVFFSWLEVIFGTELFDIKKLG